MKRAYYLPMWIVTGAIIGFFCSRSCEQVESIQVNQPNIKPIIKRIDSIKYVDRIMHDTVIKYRTKYRYLRDTLLLEVPCDTILQLIITACDSIITKDSVAMLVKDYTIKYQDTLISNYKVITHNDTLEMKRLNKEVKRQKRQKWLVIGSAVLVGGALLTR